jgi:hypothetical protein
MSKKLKKISDVPYEGEKKTVTDSLTQDQIKDLCDGYSETKFNDLKLMHHARYFVLDKKTKKPKFRMGGTILKIYNEVIVEDGKVTDKKYIVLTNGSLNWSVQKEGTIFFQAKSILVIEDELKEKYTNIIAKKDDEIDTLNKYVKHLEKMMEQDQAKQEIKNIKKVTYVTPSNDKVKKNTIIHDSKIEEIDELPTKIKKGIVKKK